MSVYKDGLKGPEFKPGEIMNAHDLPREMPKGRAAQALYEGACVHDDAERVAEYEKNWKEGDKVNG